MNKVILIGRFTKDIEARETSGGTVAKSTIAVDRFSKNEKSADFISVVFFGKNAENVSRYCKKGSPIAIEGRIQTGSYEDKDGKKVYTTDVIVERMEFIAGAKNTDDSNISTGNEFGNNFEDDITPIADDDMPF